ncbi:hypothetical protein DJ568_13145 [Mucilaginibacter hurinus]|uniref:DUF4397 domain-containing protein n=1 Tax=Mucilaginibacter hurinus TaxID=2201324 RepID=A0A367GLA2_9SPHI|nr:DUF4397 domain-containing protein [Mucilaginibacter hurinus]RCH54239.1 hypothetical protein DJ568_13145 [Mucilaginibacter hurinus]
MKTYVQVRLLKLVSLLMVLFVALAITSCSKDKDDNKRGDARVMIVNAVEGSAEQNFYLDNNKLNSSALAYGESTSYLSTTAGTRKAEFRSESSSTANVSFDLPLVANKNYSIFYAGPTSSATYMVTEDDITPPPAGKAKIRFVHLATAFETGIDVGVVGASKFVNNLKFKTASAFSNVDANSAFALFATGSTTALLTIPTPIDEGKIYTIYVTGSTPLTIKYRIIIRS